MRAKRVCERSRSWRRRVWSGDEGERMCVLRRWRVCSEKRAIHEVMFVSKISNGSCSPD